MEKDFPRIGLDLGRSDDRDTFTFETEFPVRGPEGDEIPCRASVKVDSTRTGSRYLLEVKIDAVVRGECSRCLESFDLKIDTGFEQVLQRGGAVPEGVEDEDFVILSEAQEYDFDLFPAVRETVVLELPIKYLCAENCAGICPGCGVDLNRKTCECGEKAGDPRWGPLKKLLKEEDDK